MRVPPLYGFAVVRMTVPVPRLVMEVGPAQTGTTVSACGFGKGGKPEFWIGSDGKTTPPMHVAFDYTRSTGPVLGRFLAGLRDGHVVGGRTSEGKVVGALKHPGESVASVDALIARLRELARPGDHLVFMSNGGFEGAPRRALAALAE